MEITLTYKPQISNLLSPNLLFSVKLKSTSDFFIQTIPENIILSPENQLAYKLFGYIFSMFEAGKKFSNIYHQIYVYPKSDFIDYFDDDNQELLTRNIDVPYIVINKSKKRVNKFIQELCNKALHIRDVIRSNDNKVDAVKESRFFISGDIGTGKSAFLNFVFSTNHEGLKEAQVIWVRVDLNKTQDCDLRQSADIQLCRIFKNHYFLELNSALKDELYNTIKNNYKINPSAFENDYINFFDTSDANNIKYNDLLFSGIKSFVKKHFGLIIIFDGLDKIYVSENYEKRLAEAKQIISSEKELAIYIFVMRVYSQKTFFELHFKEKEFFNNATGKYGLTNTFTIEKPDLNELVIKRLEIVKDVWRNVLDNNKGSIFKYTIKELSDENFKNQKLDELKSKIGNNLDGELAYTYFKLYIHYLLKALSIHQDVYEEEMQLDFAKDFYNLFGTNFRNLLDILTISSKSFLEGLQLENISYLDFMNLEFNHIPASLKKRILKRHYKVLPNILGQGNGRYKHPEKYKIIKGRLESLNGIHNQPYIYNVFYSINETSSFGYYNLFCRLRVLQFFNLHIEGIKNESDIIEYIHKHFNYEINTIQLALKNLKHWHYITSSMETNFEFKLVITDLGKHMLNTLIYDFNYLRIILDDILIPEPIYSHIIDSNYETFKSNKSKWIVFQVPRVLKFVELLQYINDLEVKNFNKKDKEIWNLTFNNKVLNGIKKIYISSMNLWGNLTKEDFYEITGVKIPD